MELHNCFIKPIAPSGCFLTSPKSFVHIVDVAAERTYLEERRPLSVDAVELGGTLGRIGFEGRFDYAAIGAVPNLAARLCDEAKDGQILIDGKVKAAVEAAAQLEPLEELKLKGFHRPIKAFNVRGLSG
jgi:hypothetical protein